MHRRLRDHRGELPSAKVWCRPGRQSSTQPRPESLHTYPEATVSLRVGGAWASEPALYSITLACRRQAVMMVGVLVPSDSRSGMTRNLFSLLLLCLAAHAQQPAAPSERAAPRGAIDGRLTWFDREGKAVGTIGDPGVYRTLAISPDGKRVAVERTDPQTQNRDIWLLDAVSGATTRFTSDPGW